MSSKKFIDSYYEGIYSLDDLPEYMNANQIKEGNPEAYEFLGLTKDEYKLWQNNNSIELDEILRVKKLRIEIIAKAKVFLEKKLLIAMKRTLDN